MRPLHFVLFLSALAAFAVFFELGRRDVVEANEGQRATPPAEMIRSGDFVIPTINGKDYLAKPPLIYWMIAGVYAVTGTISPLTARIPTAACFVVLVLCVYAFARRGGNETAARWGALAVMASPYVLDRGRYAELDVPLTLATFLALAAFFGACNADGLERRLGLAALGGVAFGAGIMLKGPVPFLFLAAAWLAQTVLSGADSAVWMRKAAPWTAGALALGAVQWLTGMFAPGVIRFPIALVLVAGAWTVLAWRQGGAQRMRFLCVAAGIMVVGIAVAAPWGIAVLAREGWPFVDRLLHSEVLERTHTASRINSGSPFYYVLGLLGMLAPWGLLLPCQCSARLWNGGTPLYRFSVLTGWMSVLIFSLIAGKEYEYVLPAVPFLLIGVGYALDAMERGAVEGWVARWLRVWRAVMPPLLMLLAAGFFVWVLRSNRPLYLSAALVAAAFAALTWRGYRYAPQRLACLFGMALCAILLWTFGQNYRYTGQRSFKAIAQVTADLLRNGYEVEAVKMTEAFDVFPGFAFHVGRNVPTVTDGDLSAIRAHVQTKLEGGAPYFCVLPMNMLERAVSGMRTDFATPLVGPYTTKRVVLIGNRAVPVATRPAR